MKLLQDKHPMLSLSEQLAELCRPLEAFGIHHFTYLKQYRDGHRVSLSNKAAWIEAYYNLGLYQSSLFEESTPDSLATFNVWFGDYDLDVYRHGKMYFNTMHSISIVEHNKDHYESYLFATSPDKPECINFLSNNREILYHFIMYMKDRGKMILTDAEKNKIHLSHQRDESTRQYTDWLQNSDLAKQLLSQKEKFFIDTPVHSFVLDTHDFSKIKFSNREIVCIKHLLNFKTAKDTADLMGISARTVESYFDNIKNKLGCSSKAELIAILKNIPYLNQ